MPYFILFLISLLPAWAAEDRLVSLDDISATQTAVGKAEVDGMILEWAREAKSPEEFKAILSSKIQSRESPGVIGPSLWKKGATAIYIKDGHHRAAAVHRVLFSEWENLPPEVKTHMDKDSQRVWKSSNDLKLKLRVEEEYLSLDDLLDSFRLKGYGQIPSAHKNTAFLRAQKEWKKGDRDSHFFTLLKTYQKMAPNLRELQDNPWRSAVGSTFFRMGIRGEIFENYIEFLVAEEMEKHYPTLERYLQSPISQETQNVFGRILLKDPKVRKVLEENLKEGAKNKFLELWHGLNPRRPTLRGCPALFSAL